MVNTDLITVSPKSPHGRIQAAVKRHLAGRSRLEKILLLSALVIIFARILAPFEVGKDQGVQIEAAQHLADGQGLTTLYFSSPNSYDLAQSPAPQYLTWWPPAFSLVLAGFLVVGVPLLISLKLIYSLATLLGWFGWASIAGKLMPVHLRWRGRSFPIQFLIAAVLPVFFTPSWTGTDLFLWAGIPFVVILLAAGEARRPNLAASFCAGLIFGLLCQIRYSSLFIGLGAMFVIFQSTYPDLKLGLKKFALFGLATACFLIPQMVYNRAYTVKSSVLPAIVS